MLKFNAGMKLILKFICCDGPLCMTDGKSIFHLDENSFSYLVLVSSNDKLKMTYNVAWLSGWLPVLDK